MSRAPAWHRRMVAHVEATLGTREICRCGATLATFADKCQAALDERCAGFEAIEAAKQSAPADCRP